MRLPSLACLAALGLMAWTAQASVERLPLNEAAIRSMLSRLDTSLPGATSRKRSLLSEPEHYGVDPYYTGVYTSPANLPPDLAAFEHGGTTPALDFSGVLLDKLKYPDVNYKLGAAESKFNLKDYFEHLEEDMCVDPEHIPSKFVPAGCQGPVYELELIPFKCVKDPTVYELVCEPAKLVKRIKPGKCHSPYLTSECYKSRECKESKMYGEDFTKVKGGTKFPFNPWQYYPPGYDSGASQLLDPSWIKEYYGGLSYFKSLYKRDIVTDYKEVEYEEPDRVVEGEPLFKKEEGDGHKKLSKKERKKLRKNKKNKKRRKNRD